jgi:hypothetical protein
MTKIRNSKTAQVTIYAYEHGYRITTDGKVISPEGKELSQRPDKNGYFRFGGFRLPGFRQTWSVAVHQLVAYQKFGEHALYEEVHVRHLDGNCQNNSPINIDIGSINQNMMDKDPLVRKRAAKIAASFNRKLTIDERNSLILDRNNGMTYKLLMDKYGIAKSTVSYIVNNKTYQD